MFRYLFLIIGTVVIGYIAYTGYGYRYMLAYVQNNADTSMIMGDLNAENTITVYTDYDTATSRRLYPVLLRLSAIDPDVNILFRPVATNSNTSQMATRIALAAKENGRFLDVNNAFLNGNADLDQNYMKGLIRSLGLNYEELVTLGKSEIVNQDVEAIKREQSLLQIDTLPTFFVDHVRLEGPIHNVRELQELVRDIRKGRR
jgi:protein-disulfide isomerase